MIVALLKKKKRFFKGNHLIVPPYAPSSNMDLRLITIVKHRFMTFVKSPPTRSKRPNRKFSVSPRIVDARDRYINVSGDAITVSESLIKTSGGCAIHELGITTIISQ